MTLNLEQIELARGLHLDAMQQFREEEAVLMLRVGQIGALAVVHFGIAAARADIQQEVRTSYGVLRSRFKAAPIVDPMAKMSIRKQFGLMLSRNEGAIGDITLAAKWAQSLTLLGQPIAESELTDYLPLEAVAIRHTDSIEAGS